MDVGTIELKHGTHEKLIVIGIKELNKLKINQKVKKIFAFT